MSKRACHLVLAFALLGVLTGGAAARTAALELRTTGLVARVDDHHNLVIVNDGHMLRATPAPSSWLGDGRRPSTRPGRER